MLKITNKTVENEIYGTNTNYTVEGTVKLAMDSIADYTGSDTVEVTNIQVYTHADDDGNDDNSNVDVNVTHNTTWDIYTDSGFEKAISNVLGMDVGFTEQGMQEDERASMET